MPATSAVSVSSLFKYPYIVDRISRIGAVSAAISNFYGMGIRASGREGQLISGTQRSDLPQFVADIFNNTRLTSTLRAREVGPAVIKPQKVGQVVANSMRFYEMRPFSLNQIANMRRLGSNRTDQLDAMGQEYLTRQMDDQIRRAVNMREFALVNAMKGGFKVVKVGEDNLQCVPTSYSSVSAEFSVDFQVPATHKSQINLGGGNIIDASWSTASTKIITHLRKIRAIAVERSGLPITDMWCNTTVFNYILNCTEAQNQGGSSFRVFDSLSVKEAAGSGPDFANVGRKEMLNVVLRALPELTIHVYDDGLVLPKDQATPAYAEDYVETADSNSQFVKFLSDTEVLLTPPPSRASEWLDMYAVMEIIQRGYADQPEQVYGMAAWGRRRPDPVPQYEFHVLDNYCPFLKIPNAIYNPTVTGF